MINKILRNQFSARNRRLKKEKINYLEYLKSDRWREVKNFVSKFKEFKQCEVCSSIKNLNIHHKSYVKIFESRLKIQKAYLTCLCKNCHLDVHKLAQEKGYGLRQGIKKYKELRVR